jgi:hypothetical protein
MCGPVGQPGTHGGGQSAATDAGKSSPSMNAFRQANPFLFMA